MPILTNTYTNTNTHALQINRLVTTTTTTTTTTNTTEQLLY